MSDQPDERDRLRELLGHMADLEKELEEEIRLRSDDVVESLIETRSKIESDVRRTQDRVRESLRSWLARSEPRNILSAPFIYAMIVPIAFLDLTFSLYQSICFRLYRVERVRRSDWIVVDRHRLPCLNPVEKVNCVYCGYANGVLAYASEIAARTEQYWCPIKHAKRAVGTHARYRNFVEYGEEHLFHSELIRLRGELESAPNATRETSPLQESL